MSELFDWYRDWSQGVIEPSHLIESALAAFTIMLLLVGLVLLIAVAVGTMWVIGLGVKRVVVCASTTARTLSVEHISIRTASLNALVGLATIGVMWGVLYLYNDLSQIAVNLAYQTSSASMANVFGTEFAEAMDLSEGSSPIPLRTVHAAILTTISIAVHISWRRLTRREHTHPLFEWVWDNPTEGSE